MIYNIKLCTTIRLKKNKGEWGTKHFANISQQLFHIHIASCVLLPEI